jgi:hypothetical protein
MVHSEQMFTLDGPIRLGSSSAGGSQIENRSKFILRSACVVRRPTREEFELEGRRFEGRFLGQLLPGQSLPFSERMNSLGTDKPAFSQERLEESRSQTGEPLNLEPMFKLALDPQYIEEGETRLVARVDEVMPGQTITPEASQVRGATFIVAHLEYAPPPTPQKDRNIKRDIKADDPNEDEQLELEF